MDWGQRRARAGAVAVTMVGSMVEVVTGTMTGAVAVTVVGAVTRTVTGAVAGAMIANGAS